MKHKAKLRISRPFFFGDGRRKISIAVKDTDARIEFLELEINLDKFAECLTGMADVECEMEFRGLENVGKKIETMPLEFEVEERCYGDERKQNAINLARNAAPKGWSPSTYFGSQSSFFQRNGKSYARTSASRWVEKCQDDCGTCEFEAACPDIKSTDRCYKGCHLNDSTKISI